MKIIKWTILFLIVFCAVFILIANSRVNKTTNGQIFDNADSIPYNKAGLLLGTSKYLKSGTENQYFTNRIKAAAALFNAKKIDFIVISGDNSRENYNEPLDMKNDLVNLGIPGDKIYLDYAGFRTFDSVVRMNKIFGQTSFTIISQQFHNQRAIFIANHKRLNAIGYNAQDVDAYSGFKTNVREKLARVKVFLDLWTGKEPKFLGEKIELE